MAGTRRRRAGKVIGGLLALVIVIAVALGFFFRQDIDDIYQAETYAPSDRIAQIASDIQLTNRGERVFFATHPTIDGSQDFSVQCANVDHSDDGHLLGCYTNDEIRLFEVDDDRINDIVEVTAAHELLHASYARLRVWEKSWLEPRLIEVYDQLAEANEDLRNRMSVYEHLPADRFANEIHSVLGTEVADLPQDLEDYYAKWFTDRALVVERFQMFQRVFDELQAQADALSSEMDALRADIDRRSDEYASAVELFNADVLDFNMRNERFEFSDNPYEGERIREALTYRKGELEATRQLLEIDIERYNAMRDELIKLGEMSEELDQKLDANLAPV